MAINRDIYEKRNNLIEFFKSHPNGAIAFSGGVDSAYLLYAAKRAEADVGIYYVKSQFQPEFELEDARKLCALLGLEMNIIPLDTLKSEDIAQNPANRCYYCKKMIFGTLIHRAKKDGYSLIFDGTNASDSFDDRPGMRALEELSVLSPLRLCALTKDEIRTLSKDAGLFTWDKPSYSCLATRVETGNRLTPDILRKIEAAEGYLFSLGFSDFRVRVKEDTAKLQVRPEQIDAVISHREPILNELKKHFNHVVLDLEVRN